MAPIEYILLGASGLLLISILASKASQRLGIPALLLFLVIGMLAGSDGPGGIYFDDPYLAELLGIVALVLILFDGGLDTKWGDLRPALWPGLALSTLGVLITATLVGWFAIIILHFSWLEGLLLGAVVSATDAAAVFSVLRATHVRLKGILAPLLELESASNDPMAVFLALSFLYLLSHPGVSPAELILRFFQQMGIGAVVGLVMGWVMVFLVNRVRLSQDGLYPAFTLSLVFLTYAVTTIFDGSGFLAVYLAGLVMGSWDFTHKDSLMRFHDGLAWLTQIGMFLTLGLLVFPSQLVPIFISGLAMAGVLIFLARPVSVLLCLLLTSMPLNEKLFVSWVGLRGAAPIILATFPLLAGTGQARLIFNLVFFIVLTSILLQGTSIPLVARW
ncbi:MAG TPA: potassium/proton antiporter, partial [Ktedonobacterales bacterium]